MSEGLEEMLDQCPFVYLTIVAFFVAEIFRHCVHHKLAAWWETPFGSETNANAITAQSQLEPLDILFLVALLLGFGKAFLMNYEKGTFMICAFFIWIGFMENNFNVSLSDEDVALSSGSGSGGVAVGLAWNYWTSYLQHVHHHPSDSNNDLYGYFKVVLVPTCCRFKPPDAWQVEPDIAEIPQKRDFNKHLRRDSLKERIFWLRRDANDEEGARVLVNFPTILKSALGPTKEGIRDEYREAEVSAFVNVLQGILDKNRNGPNRDVRIFTFHGEEDLDNLQERILDFLEA